MSESSEKIIEKIHEQKIRHRPRWYFLIKNISVWIAFSAAIILGALAVSLEEAVLERGAVIHNFRSFELFHFLFQGVSLLWIISIFIFIGLAFLNLRLTKEGYRYGAWWIILGLLLVIATFALLFHNEGLGDRAESLIEHQSFYHNSFFGPADQYNRSDRNF